MNAIQRELAQALLEIAELYPEWRFGQTVANVAAWAGQHEPLDVWNVSDEDLLRAARNHLARRSEQMTAGASRKGSH